MISESVYGVSGFGEEIHQGQVTSHVPPQKPLTEEWGTPTSEERIAALLAHGGTFFAWMLAPVMVYMLKRNESRYVEFHALQAMLWSLLGTVIAAATCGLAIPVFMVFHGIAAYKTLSGEPYEYPFVARFARSLMA
jgi:hypothetical protein